MKRTLSKKKKLFLKLAIYIVAFLVFSFLAVHFFVRANDKQVEFENFKTAASISEDMRIGFIISRFEVSEEEILNELKLPVNHWNKRHTVAQACKKKKLDCNVVIDNLNKKYQDD